MTEPAASAQQPQPNGPTSLDGPYLGAIFTLPEAPDTWTADASWPADSPIPYTLTPKAETLLQSNGCPTPPLRNGHACDMRTRPPQAQPSLPGQPVTYVTEISLPPSDSGIQRLHARMKEPGPEPEAGL